MDINLEYYKIFYYVGKLKSITLAAEELSLSQPAISQAVKHLETNIGTVLFVRTGKGVRLTLEGEVLYSYIQRGYEYMLLGENKLKELLNLDCGEIRIGASDMTLKFYLLSYLEKFHERYPKIKVTVTNAPTPQTLKFMQEGRIDFGIVSTPIKKKKGLIVKEVRAIEDVFVGGRQFEELKGKILPYKQLESLPIVCLEGTTSTREYVEEFLKERDVFLSPEFELATSDMLVQFARKNLGIASVVKDFAKEYLENRELFQLHFNEPIPKRHFCVISDEKIPMSSAARSLLQMLEDEQR